MKITLAVVAAVALIAGVVVGTWLSRPPIANAQGQTVVYLTRVKIGRKAQGQQQTIPGQPLSFSCGTLGVESIQDVDCYVLSKD